MAKSKLKEWQDKGKEGGTCEKCKREVPLLTVDHIVPVSVIDMLDDTGEMKYNREENFRLLCYPCNRFKAGRIDKTCPTTLKILKKLLE